MFSKTSFLILILFFAYIGTARNYSGIEVIESTPKKLIIKYTPVFSGFEVTDLRGESVEMPMFKFADYDTDGNNIDISRSISITVPSETGFSLANIKMQDVTFFNEKADDKIKFNHDFGELEYSGIVAGRHIAKLTMYPFRKASSNSSMIPKNITFEINFDDSKAEKSKTSKNLYGSISINDKDVPNWRVSEKKKPKLLSEDEISSGNWFKIRISEQGVYRITAQQLDNLGANITAADVRTIKVFGYGGKALDENAANSSENYLPEQEIIVNSNADGTLKDLIFYGAPTRGFEFINGVFERYINPYSKENYYLLTYGGRDGERAEAADISETPSYSPSTYHHMILHEEERINPYTYGSGREWLGESAYNEVFVDRLHNLDRSGNIKIKVAAAHNSRNSAGEFDIYQNSQNIGNIFVRRITDTYDAAIRAIDEFEIPASSIQSDNRSNLRLEYNNSQSGAGAWLDRYEIHYPRSFTAIENEINFFDDNSNQGITEYTISGFSPNEIFAFDITDKADPKLLRNRATTGSILIFRSEENTEFRKEYYASSELKSPNLTKVEITDFRRNQPNADVIVITHRDFVQSANEYKAYREQTHNYNIQVITTDEIFNEFAAGLPDVTAIRDYISFAYANWENKPKYVVLWGDGHFDFKNISTNLTNYVPAYQNDWQSNVFDDIYSYSTEDYFVDVVGDDEVIEMPIGRLTINSNQEGIEILEKIKNYEQNSSVDQWRSNILLVADDSWAGNNKNPDGDLHVWQSEDVSHLYIPNDFQQFKIYMPEYEAEPSGSGIKKPGVTRDLIYRINNDGAVILNWIGHGNPRVWGHEFIFEKNVNIPQMTNKDKAFFLTAATCDFGRFDSPEIQSGAEELLMHEMGGAIGVFTATRVVLSLNNSYINNDFYSNLLARDELTGEYPTIGDAYFRVKLDFNGTNDRKFFLLGDPLMRLNIPENRVVFDEINETPVEDIIDPINLKALSRVEIKGRIVNPNGEKTLDNFNGSLVLQVFEGDEYYSIFDPYRKQYYEFTKTGGALNRSSYKVENGYFTASFIIPKDISYSDSLGRMLAFAYSEEEGFAKGGFRNFRVNDIVPTDITDREGPEINIYLDSRNFESGDLVSKEPLLIVDLFDESGLNTTGSGIGHKIEAWLDDNPNSIDLTREFTTSLEDGRRGNANVQLFDLEPGVHTIMVRAWDVFNNWSTAEVTFVMDDEDDPYVISNLINYPNPFFDDGTTIRFEHNASGAYQVKIEIFNMIGNNIKTINQSLSTLNSVEIYWDGTNKYGKQVPIGVYSFNITLTDLEGKTGTQSAVLGVKQN